MAYKQADFKPVLPNITDDSMREVDADIEMVRRQNESRKERTKVSSEKKTQSPGMESKSGETRGEQKSSLGRKIVIGVLIVVIIVLLVLLIYQIYKYYTTDEVSLVQDTGGNSGGPPLPITGNDKKIPPSLPDKESTGSYVCDDDVVSIPQSTGGIPQSVRNLDNDLLAQYIKKGENASIQRRGIDAKEQTRARNTAHKSMIHDIQKEELTDSSEIARISQIIDETREAPSEIYTNDEDIPSREDIIQQMQRDMVKDQRQSATLESIEEEHNDNIINNFLSEGEDEDDSISVNSEDGGCQFLLTKGKNMGQTCGRKRSTETRCNRHRNK